MIDLLGNFEPSILAAAIPSNLPWILLGIGAFLLWLSLLVLMLSRLGEARPIAKCAVLSVFAHILFIGFAYLTDLLPNEATQPSRGSDSTRVSFVEFTEQNEQPLEVNEWDQAETTFSPPAVDETIDRLAIPDRDPTPMAPIEPETQMNIVHDEMLEIETVEAPDFQDQPEIEEQPQNDDRSDESVLEAPTIADSVTLPEIESLPRQEIESSAVPIESIVEKSIADEIHKLLDETHVDDESEAYRSDQEEQASQERVIADSGPREPETLPPQNRVRATYVKRRQPQRVPHRYRKRVQRRPAQIKQQGGDASTEAAVEAGLEWLASAQSERDGRWDASRYQAGSIGPHESTPNSAGADADTATTGLALLAFLGAGYTHVDGPYKQNVQEGLQFLLRSQRRSSGDLSGNATKFAKMYCHGIATLALSEAYILTSDERIRPFLERAIQYTLNSQNKETGGWRYRPHDDGDTSQFGWQLMALMSAKAAGLDVPPSSIRGMKKWLRGVSSGYYGGLASYRPGQRPSHAMTAEALVCRLLLDPNTDVDTIQEAANFTVREGLRKDPLNLYFCYYATMALYQVQDHRWIAWNNQMKARLLPLQRTNGQLSGSWDPDTVWGRNGGRVYTTALATMCLQTYYRYDPVPQESVHKTARRSIFAR